MPESLLVWALTTAVGALAIVLWFLGRRAIAKLDSLEKSVNESISALKLSVATDMGGIRERLARLEGHAGIGK